MRCEICGRDLNEIWQDNMADGQTYNILCEDCYSKYKGIDEHCPLDRAIIKDKKALIDEFKKTGNLQIKLENDEVIYIQDCSTYIKVEKVKDGNITYEYYAEDYGDFHDIEEVLYILNMIGVLFFKD